MLSEFEDDAAHVTEAVLIVGAGKGICKAGQHVIEIGEAESNMVINTHIYAASDQHHKGMLCAGNINGAAAIHNLAGKTAVSVRVGLAKQNLAVHDEPAQGKPDNGPEPVSKHVPVAFEGAGGNCTVRGHHRRSLCQSPLRAAIALKIGADAQDFREIELNATSTAVKRPRLKTAYSGIELDI